MDRLNLNLLPIALALYEERSVSAAAKALGMSQPAVSMALRKLREHFNDPLFIRSVRGVEPTPRARALVKASRPLVARLQENLLAEESFDAARSTRAFTFALFGWWRRSSTTRPTSGASAPLFEIQISLIRGAGIDAGPRAAPHCHPDSGRRTP